MYRILSLENSNDWMEIINSFRKTDIYYYPGYLKPFYENGDGEPNLFYFENEYGRAVNVFLKRDINDDERLKPYTYRGQYFDISTVYGYGGPIFEAYDYEKLCERYSIEFAKYCKDINAVTEFIRFHPIIKNHVLPDESYEIQNIRSTVYMDLRHSEKNIWDCLESNCKRNIKKAISNNINISYSRDKSLLDEFIELYIQTMSRDNASNYYYFNNKFFHSTLNELPENSLIFAASYKEKIIGACIILFTNTLVHFHFGGSNVEYQNLRANNLLMYEVAKWGCMEGKKFFHLGGGVSGDSDSLFRFKKSFSKATPLPFYVGRKIYDRPLYKKLTELRAVNDKEFNVNSCYFPKYRG